MKSIIARKDLIKHKKLEELNDLDNAFAYSLASGFLCDRVPELQKYISGQAFTDDEYGNAKTYIVYDAELECMIAYYSLRTNSMFRQLDLEEQTEITKGIDDQLILDESKNVQSIIPTIEITKFAVNDKYLRWLADSGYDSRGIGKFVFRNYMISTIFSISEKVGFQFVTLFAINDNKVIDAYINMGFETLEDDRIKIFSSFSDTTNVRDFYSRKCKFMCQDLENILLQYEGDDNYVN